MEPMPLDNLREQLRKAQETGSTEAIVVDMGMIAPDKSPWLRNTLFAACVALFLGIGVFTYDRLSTNKFTVIVDASTSQGMSQMVSDSGGRIIAVKQTGDSTYELEVSTRDEKNTFLDRLRQKLDVKSTQD